MLCEMSVVKRIECTLREDWVYWEELKCTGSRVLNIWDIVRRTKRKQVPSWDPRQHVECWGPFTEIESSRLDFQLSTHMTVKWMRHENRVQWTRFLCMENEFKELSLCVWKPSSTNSVSIHRNRVLWTRFLCFVHISFSRKSSPLDLNC